MAALVTAEAARLGVVAQRQGAVRAHPAPGAARAVEKGGKAAPRAQQDRLPGALPHLFTGLRLASALAVIAAVVAEYFGGLQTGLGSRITSAASNSAYPRAWAYVTAACLLGLVFYAAALLLERVATPWRARTQR